MRISTVRIRNFRCFEDERIDLRDFTVLVGRNSAGKSTVLRALQHFYDPGLQVDGHDFHGGFEPGDEIEIAVTFADLTAKEAESFGRYVRAGKLEVAKVYKSAPGKGDYYGFSLQLAGFASLRTVKGREFLSLYKEIQQNYGLPTVRSEPDGRAALAAYEATHASDCTPEREQGIFLGPRNIGGGMLDSFTGFVFVPAVREAHDLVEGRDGPIADLLTRIVLPALEGKPDLKNLKSEVETRLRGIFDASNSVELPDLAKRITAVLEDYAPGAALRLWWHEVETPAFKFPPVNRSLADDGWESPVGKVGHGLQRSLIIALLQHEEEQRRKSSDPATAPEDAEAPKRSVIFAIEEPELYLHPSRCRHLAGVLSRLAAQGSGGIQVICATHSPFFLDLAHFPSVRVVRKVPSAGDGPRTSRVSSCNEEAAAKALADATEADRPEQFTGETLLANLRRVLHPNPAITEGFFADVAMLVEGETEVGLFVEWSRIVGLDWERLGIVVVPCGGKRNMDRPALIFRQLGIPTFLLFDGDKKRSAGEESETQVVRENRSLRRLCGDPSVGRRVLAR